jgi:hypothetical protein
MYPQDIKGEEARGSLFPPNLQSRIAAIIRIHFRPIHVGPFPVHIHVPKWIPMASVKRRIWSFI